MTVETIVLNRPIVEIVGEGEVFRRWQTRQGALVFQIASDGVTLAESLANTGDVTARDGAATETLIGDVGGKAGVLFGSAGDTNIYRSSANVLQTDDSLVVVGDLTVGSSTGGARLFNIKAAAGNGRDINFQTAATNRFQLRVSSAAESGGDAGSNFEINRYNDAGVFQDSAISITRSNGAISIPNNITIGTNAGAARSIIINAAAANERAVEYRTANSVRWKVLTNATAESGSNVGSNFQIQRYSDAGSFVANNLTISRDSGAWTFEDGLAITLGTTTGTKIGTATTQKLGFFNAAPVVQQAAVADAAGGATIDAEARTAINSLLARIRTLGLIAT